MTDNSKNIALILAGGNGHRMHNSVPKQYVEVCGKTVLQHTLHAFDTHPQITCIYVVCDPEWADAVSRDAVRHGVHKFAGTIQSGITSMHSILNGIRYISAHESDKQSIVLVHDCVRPLVSHSIITSNIEVCRRYGNAITAISSNEAFMLSDDGVSSHAFLPRDKAWRAQTPHTFRLEQLEQICDVLAERRISESQSLFTLANDLGVLPLHIAEGELTNFKITVPSDMALFERIIR